jgi:hypothetical protein
VCGAPGKATSLPPFMVGPEQAAKPIAAKATNIKRFIFSTPLQYRQSVPRSAETIGVAYSNFK